MIGECSALQPHESSTSWASSRSPKTGAELFVEVFSRRYERGSILVTINLPFYEWTEVFGSERLTGALLDRLTHRVHILEMNGESRADRLPPRTLPTPRPHRTHSH